MKKLIALILACTTLFSVTACGGDSSTIAAGANSSAVETVKDETSAKEDETVTTTEQTTTEKSEETTDATTEPVSENSDNSAAETDAGTQDAKGSLLIALINRMKDWKGQSHISIKAEQDGMSMLMDMVMAGKKFFYTMDMAGLFKMTGLSDGTVTYLIDDETKTYAKNVNSDDLSMATPDSMVGEMQTGKFVKTGTGKFHNKEYTYEEYKTKKDEDGEELPVKYFFDSNGDIIGMTSKDSSGKDQEIDFTIKLEEKIDESRFTLPSGYTEKESKAFMEELLGKMLMAIFGALEDSEISQ